MVPWRVLVVLKGTTMRTIAKRLFPGQDPLKEILKISSSHNSKSGIILSLVGSLRLAHLRFADNENGTRLKGPFEIVSATGTFGMDQAHIHVSISDARGQTLGGHLLEGSEIYTTIELVIGDLSRDWQFDRQLCNQTNFLELVPTEMP